MVVGPSRFVGEAIEDYVTVPEEYSLFQNMPNPFNDLTTIRFNLPEESNVNLTIYDVLGRKVATIVSNEQYGPGSHLVFWDGKDQLGKPVSSGVYLYQMHAGDFIQTHKMLLLRWSPIKE